MLKKLIENVYKNEEKILKILIDESKNINDENFKDSIFYKNGFEISFAFTANRDLFWKFYKYFDEKQIIEDEIDLSLERYGISIIENFFNEEEINKLKTDWKETFNNFYDFNDYEIEYARRHDVVVKKIGEIEYVLTSEILGRKRIAIHNKEKLPLYYRKFLSNNTLFIEKVKNYFNIKFNFTEDTIMSEYLCSPKFLRSDKYWHIDNLKDQMKVMIVLEDINENDGPFTYIPGSQKLIDKYKNRYHQMYKMIGFKTTICNHFEDDFLCSNNIKQTLLKKGDIIIFDTRLHHTGVFPYNGGERKNIVIYFSNLPTIRNIIFTNIDKYKDVRF